MDNSVLNKVKETSVSKDPKLQKIEWRVPSLGKPCDPLNVIAASGTLQPSQWAPADFS